jgi:hypothetical protein
VFRTHSTSDSSDVSSTDAAVVPPPSGVHVADTDAWSSVFGVAHTDLSDAPQHDTIAHASALMNTDHHTLSPADEFAHYSALLFGATSPCHSAFADACCTLEDVMGIDNNADALGVNSSDHNTIAHCTLSALMNSSNSVAYDLVESRIAVDSCAYAAAAAAAVTATGIELPPMPSLSFGVSTRVHDTLRAKPAVTKSKRNSVEAVSVTTAPLSCAHCTKTFSTALALRRHARLHTDTEFVCAHCGEVFRYAASRWQHVQSIHKRRKYLCDCGKEYSGMLSLLCAQLSHICLDDTDPSNLAKHRRKGCQQS